MASTVSVHVEGLDELRIKLREANVDLGSSLLPKANRSSAELVAQSAKPFTPQRTGALARSIRPLTSPVGQVRAGGASVLYAGAIHWGRNTGNVGRPPGNHPGPNRIMGRPFLTDTIRRENGRVVLIYRSQLDALLHRAGLE